ncbi:hypothetical protein D3C87_1713020 [compost metagenome]
MAADISNRRGKDDRAAVADQRRQPLDGEKGTLGVDGELAIVGGLRHLVEWLEQRCAGVDVQEIDRTQFLPDRRPEHSDLAEIGDI